jgi:hypothetical protein
LRAYLFRYIGPGDGDQPPRNAAMSCRRKCSNDSVTWSAGTDQASLRVRNYIGTENIFGRRNFRLPLQLGRTPKRLWPGASTGSTRTIGKNTLGECVSCTRSRPRDSNS